METCFKKNNMFIFKVGQKIKYDATIYKIIRKFKCYCGCRDNLYVLKTKSGLKLIFHQYSLKYAQILNSDLIFTKGGN